MPRGCFAELAVFSKYKFFIWALLQNSHFGLNGFCVPGFAERAFEHSQLGICACRIASKCVADGNTLHEYIHIHIHTCTNAYAYVHAHAFTCTYMHTHVHTYRAIAERLQQKKETKLREQILLCVAWGKAACIHAHDVHTWHQHAHADMVMSIFVSFVRCVE